MHETGPETRITDPEIAYDVAVLEDKALDAEFDAGTADMLLGGEIDLSDREVEQAHAIAESARQEADDAYDQARTSQNAPTNSPSGDEV